MSIGIDGVKFNRRPAIRNSRRRKYSSVTLLFLFGAEFLLSFVLYVSLAAHLLWPEQSQGVAGVPKLLSYEGRLTDASGDPLGGAGLDYCFRFSIYDASTAGTKLWPTGSPTGQSITVTDGIFDAQIGSADTLDYNFYTNDTVYLNVEVATKVGGSCTNGDESYESIDPRQQISAAGYAITSANVYGDLLKTDISNGRVQIGTGTGAASPTLLALDVKNTSDTVGAACSPSGSIWYNSNNTKAMICDNGTIQEIGNASTIVGFKESSSGTTISSGTVNLSGVNGISVHQNGQTLSISNRLAFGMSNIGNTAGNSGTQTGTIVFSGQANITLSQITGAGGVHTLGISAAGGGGGGAVNLIDFDNLGGRIFLSNITNMTAISQRPYFIPFYLPGNITYNRIALEVSRATSGSNLFTAHAAIYTFVNNTQISRLASLSNSFSNTATASISGVRRLHLTGMEAAGSSLTPGNYVMMLYFSAAATASMNYSLRGGQTASLPVGNIFAGANSNVTATSQLSTMPLRHFMGRYTATTASPPASINLTQVQQFTSGAPVYFYIHST